MFCSRNSRARLCVKPISPNLAALCADRFASPRIPWMEATLTMRPRPRATIPGRTARQKLAAPVRFVERTRSHSSGVRLRKGFQRKTPALLTRMSTGPNSASARSTTASAAPRRVMSAGIARHCAFNRFSWAAVSSSSFSVRATSATRAPSCAKRAATERPIPRPAPVTTTVLFENFMSPRSARAPRRAPRRGALGRPDPCRSVPRGARRPLRERLPGRV